MVTVKGCGRWSPRPGGRDRNLEGFTQGQSTTTHCDLIGNVTSRAADSYQDNGAPVSLMWKQEVNTPGFRSVGAPGMLYRGSSLFWARPTWAPLGKGTQLCPCPS